MTRLAPEEYLSLQPLGDPQLSPDGSQVAYVREYVDHKRDAICTDIWLVNTEGGEPRQLTAAGALDRLPRWSPDGRRLAFLSNRGGTNQVWLIGVAGGEARVIATKEQPHSAPLWSPDGTQIGFVAAVGAEDQDPAYPGAPPGEDCRDGGPRIVAVPHHKLDGAGFFGCRWGHVFVVPAEPGEATARQVTSGRFSHQAFAWSPDGGRLACVVCRNRPGDNPAWDPQLWIYQVESGEALPLLEGEYCGQAPAWSPDGSALAFIGTMGRFAWNSSNYRVYLADLSGGLPASPGRIRDLTAGLDRPAGMAVPSDTRHLTAEPLGPLVWPADGDRLYFTAMGDGASHLYVARPGEAPHRLTSGARRVVAGGSAAAGSRLAYLAGDATRPEEVFAWDQAREVQLTRINTALADKYAWRDPERLEIRGPDGWAIEGWLLRPEGAGPHPLVLSVHGGPASMYGYGFAFLFQCLALNGFAVLYVNPRGSQGYGDRFAGAVVGDWGGKDHEDLLAAVDHVVEAGVADPHRLGVTGWSYGGYMTCWLITRTDRFRAAVAGAPVTNLLSMYGQADVGPGLVEFFRGGRPWEEPDRLSERSPVRYADRVNTPLLLLHGESDLRCPIGQSEEMFAALQRLGRTCVMVRYPGESHRVGRRLNPDRIRRTLAWFQHYLG
ncbi:MAG: S9 family peptidase [bacterium]|nr:S9 family peptidase [bacterium]